MEDNVFTKELLKVAFAATVCDGDIDDNELEVIRKIEKEDYYLKKEDLQLEIDRLSELARDNYFEFAHRTVKETYKLDLSPAQKLITINLAIAVVRADGKMQEQEITFVKNLILNLQVPSELIESTNKNWWIIESDHSF